MSHAKRSRAGERGRRIRRLAGAATLAVLLPLVAGAAEHITPTVVLRKQADVIRSTLPDATHFFLKTVQIGRRDLSAIEQTADFKPEDPRVKFYYGQNGSGSLVGVVLFPQVNTQHGPFEVGLTLGPDGTIRDVAPTKATVETKPWVEKAVGTGFLDDFRGLSAGQQPDRARKALRSADIGDMPTFAGEELAEAVEHGLALYQVLYAGSASGSAN
ncbi:MAG: hypothetical protein Q8W51_12770 [Candidatus Palauibacterales bacterium]|nr:hypothetical protein [Candidatus Palauibacterales bacterium]MDP2530593.1 hypothetical protein [Candidatus Palauibacterales bacterium]MDP2583608.1 hypothetical protein [Candidatus Palauibacterales bacterium]